MGSRFTCLLAGQGAQHGAGSGELCAWLLLSVPSPADDVRSRGACLCAGPKPDRWLWRTELGLDSWCCSEPCSLLAS